MNDIYNRSKMLIGDDGLTILQGAHIAIVGIGGVGSYVAEALARAGIGKLTLIDHDQVDVTNLNRQLHATRKTIGMPKVKAMKERIFDINPEITVQAIEAFVLPDSMETIFTEAYDYIVDAIDTVTAKIALVQWARQHGTPIVCSMGTANKIDNMGFEVTDISKTHTCPLARVMRRELKQRGILEGVKVVYAPTEVIKPQQNEGEEANRRPTPGSMSYVPGTAGLIIAGVVVQELLLDNNNLSL